MVRRIDYRHIGIFIKRLADGDNVNRLVYRHFEIDVRHAVCLAYLDGTG